MSNFQGKYEIKRKISMTLSFYLNPLTLQMAFLVPATLAWCLSANLRAIFIFKFDFPREKSIKKNDPFSQGHFFEKMSVFDLKTCCYQGAYVKFRVIGPSSFGNHISEFRNAALPVPRF